MQPSLFPPLLGPLWDLGPLPVRRAKAAALQAWAGASQRRVLLVKRWDDEAEGSVGHWVGVTHSGTVRCLLRGDGSRAAPPDPHAAAGAVLASILRVYAVWYAVTPAPGSPQPPPQHRYTCAGYDAHARAWLANRALVEAWR